jgi:hypothetical protein
MPHFRTTILQAGKTATGIEVPEAVVEALGSGKRPAVTVTVNGYSYRTTIAPMGGRFMIPVSADVRAKAQVAGGDAVEISLELDTAPREVSIPDDFRKALDADGTAGRFFDGLSYSNRLRHVLAIEGAKAPDTRQRRIDKSVADLHAGKK